MKIVFEIPKEFESHFEFDRFADSLARVASDIEALGFKMSGRYERETITMIRKAFENATPLPKGHGRLIDADALKKEAVVCPTVGNAEVPLLDIMDVDCSPTIIEADKEGSEEE
jgi:hypothetical protein